MNAMQWPHGREAITGVPCALPCVLPCALPFKLPNLVTNMLTHVPTNILSLAIAFMLALLPLVSARAQDRADLDRTQIIGNRELPKVLYIVPWKKPLPGDLNGRPVDSVLDEALAPVDRDVFRRQVRYDALARAATSGTSPSSNGTAAGDTAAAVSPPRP